MLDETHTYTRPHPSGKVNCGVSMKYFVRRAVLAFLFLFPFLIEAAWSQSMDTHQSRPFVDAVSRMAEPLNPQARSSPYVPMDSWVYPALDRLSSMGYLNDAFFGLRPWTRLSIMHMLQNDQQIMIASGDDDALAIALAVRHEFERDESATKPHIQFDNAYVRVRGISGGAPLVNSFEFGQTIINDDGRPYGHGVNAITGLQGHASAGRFSLNIRGEYQHAPGYAALPLSAQNTIAAEVVDVLTPSDQYGVGNRDNFRLLDANLSYHFLRNEISVGKSEMYWGPDKGGAFLWSTNAEPVYNFRVNLVDPVRIPFLSRILGPFRYDNYFADLKGHVSPNKPFVFGDKISFHPLPNLELGFSRSCEFAGEGESPLNAHTFLKCFFSVGDNLNAYKVASDVGDRRANFDFRLRLPYMLKSVTIYSDSISDDDPSPIANFRRSGWSPGIYISHMPGMKRIDFRFEAPYTNDSHTYGLNGDAIAYQNLNYKDGFTNKSQLIGYWIGRDSTGYQSWLTYWLSPKEKLEVEYRDVKIDHALWAGGGSQTDVSAEIIKRIKKDLEINARVQWERYLIPSLRSGIQHDVSTTLQIKWFPGTTK